MRKLTLLATLALLPCVTFGEASRLSANLKGFTAVCTNAYFEEKDVKSDAVATRLIARMDASLNKAGIPTVPGDCQKGGLKTKKQLNLYYTFVTTGSGKVARATLEGWLDQEGGYREVTLWNNDLFGEGDPGNGSIDAADFLDTLLDAFVEDWDEAH